MLRIATLHRQQINLEATLASGQSFCWRRIDPRHWTGWIGPSPCLITCEGDRYCVYGRNLTLPQLIDYFQLDFDLAYAIQSFPQDEWLARSLEYSPGLRILHQDPWETLASFICSSVKQIVQIQAINQTLRRNFGREIEPGYFGFPDYPLLAKAGESGLRDCKLGFRARHLYNTACLLSREKADLQSWHHLPTQELKKRLLALPGVGEKIADCVMLFAYSRYEVFPIDVWVERVLRQLYFARARNRRPERLRQFAQRYFGPYRGYAQQYLFHWMRTSGEID